MDRFLWIVGMELTAGGPATMMGLTRAVDPKRQRGTLAVDVRRRSGTMTPVARPSTQIRVDGPEADRTFLRHVGS